MTSKYQNGCRKTKDVNFWLPHACIENIKMAATKQKMQIVGCHMHVLKISKWLPQNKRCNLLAVTCIS